MSMQPSLRGRRCQVEGVPFHPESIAGEHGRQLLRNFLRGIPHASGEPI